MNTYMFYVETKDGSRIEWSGLSQRTAVMMYNMTYKAYKAKQNLKCFGWEGKSK